MASQTRVAILDEHGIVATALASLIEAETEGVEVVWHGASAESLIADTADRPPSILVLDAHAADAGGGTVAELVAAVGARGMRVLLLVSADVGGAARAAMSAGAAGYLSKDAAPATLFAAITTVAAGGSVADAGIAQLLAEFPAPVLSPRELEVVRLYARGMPLKSVARRLGVSEHTATEYLKRVRSKYEALGREVRTKQDLYQAAVRDGFLPPPDR